MYVCMYVCMYMMIMEVPSLCCVVVQTLELLSKFKSKVSNIRGKVPLSNDESAVKEAESREDTVKEGDNW